MASVTSLLQDKGPDVWTIAPDASVYEAIEMMAASWRLHRQRLGQHSGRLRRGAQARPADGGISRL